MTWGKIDDKLHAHLKAQRAGDAMALWVMALSWCSGYLTDGFVPKDQPLRLLGKAGPRMAATLVRVGLWEEVEDGFRFHDYLDHNPSSVDVRTKRQSISEARKAAGQLGAAARWQNGKRDGNADGIGEASGRQTSKQTDGKRGGKSMAPSRPVEEEEEGGGTRAPARAPTREAALPPPPTPNLEPNERELLDAIAEGAEERPGRWDVRGSVWQRKALAAELASRGLTADDAFVLGEFLATPQAAKELDSEAFDVDWFVFGTPEHPEFRRLDWAWSKARAWDAAQQRGEAERSSPVKPVATVTPIARPVSAPLPPETHPGAPLGPTRVASATDGPPLRDGEGSSLVLEALGVSPPRRVTPAPTSSSAQPAPTKPLFPRPAGLSMPKRAKEGGDVR